MSNVPESSPGLEMTKTRRQSLVFLIAACCVASSNLLMSSSAGAKTLTIGTDSSVAFTPPKAVFSPEPIIPEHLHEQCFKSCCIAKFLVAPSGKSSVQLISTSGSEEVDEITLQTLKRWKFKPATLDGAPVEGSKKVQVEFKVEQ